MQWQAVANDTDNHTLRRVDLKAKTVTTMAGTGKQVYDRKANDPYSVEDS